MTEGNGLSASDIMALTNNNSFFGEGLWGVILLLIVAGVIGGNGFFGGNRCEGGVTEGYVANQFTQRDIFNTNSNVIGTASDTQKEILNSKYENALGNSAIQKDIMENRFTSQLGFQNAQAGMQSCCCDLKTTIHSEGEATRALIANLDRERLMYELNQANTAIANAVQTQNILGTLGTWRANPPYAYGYGVYGTTLA